MRLFATFFATLVLTGPLTGCTSPEAPTPIQRDEPKPTPKPGTAPTEIEGPGDPGPAPTEASAGDLADPPWFDTAKIEHAKVLQAKNQAKVGPNTATATLLELAPETTPLACMAAIRSEMAKTIPDLPQAVPGDKDRLTLQGKADSYSYTVVCGPGKTGQTTLYLSYTDL
jgi:hypothetical protein